MSSKKDEKSKKIAHRLFDMQNKVRTAPDVNKNLLTINSKNVLAQIAESTPVNTLMLNYYLEELAYLSNDVLKELAPQNPIQELPNDEMLIEQLDMAGENHTDNRDIILMQLRTTMALLGYIAIRDGKLGKSLRRNKPEEDALWFDIIEACYEKILILEGKKEEIQQNDHINYLGLLLGYDLLEIDNLLGTAKNNTRVKAVGQLAAEIIDRINQKRLFWVGLGSMLSPLSKLISNTMIDGNKMVQSGQNLGQHTGRMSFILYFIRFPLHLFMLIFKTFDNRNVDEKLPLKERFKAAWAEHGAYIWNDLVWAPVNFITYFWLTGKGAPGFAGGIVTMAAFAFVDASWGITNGVMAARQYRNDLRAMEIALNAFLKNDDEVVDENQFIEPPKEIKLQILIKLSNQEIEKLIRIKYIKQDDNKEAIIQQMLAIALAAKKAHFEYQYKRNGYIITTMQGLLNATAIAMMTFSVFPPLLGPIVYIATNILINLATGVNEASKISGKIKSLQEDKLAIIAKQTSNIDDPLLAAKMEAINTEIVHLRARRTYQKAATFGKVVLDLAVTIGVYVAFAFAPFGIGIAIAVGVLIMAAILEKIGEQYIKPNMIKLVEKSLFAKEKQKQMDLGMEDELLQHYPN